ncbi:MAG: dockerin type I domain-containing protein [Hominilimicola sp.]
MKIKKYAAASVMLLILLFTSAHAQTIAEYTLEGSYDEHTQTYTAQVYLNTTEYLSAGTFGMSYDASLTPEFTLDQDNFSYFRQLTPDSNYIAFQWYLNDITPLTGKIHLGTVTIKNVMLDSLGNPKGWHKKTLRQLNWLNTSISKDPAYTTDKDGICLNDEIWRTVENDPDVDGYYQGYDLQDKDNPVWVDIGFSFDSGFNLPEREGNVISGQVESYNPNNAVIIVLYDDTGEERARIEQSAYTVKPDGRCICGYEFLGANEGSYTIEIQKDVHLTYRMSVNVNAGADTENGKITLYCGDISGDEKIKLNDRSELLRHMNRRIYYGSDRLSVRSDLNGDGKVTTHDFNILKSYYNRKYEGAV